MGVDQFLVRFGAISGPYYQESPPASDLRHLIACNWVRVVRLDGAPPFSPIIPDGCADIMVYDDSPPQVAGPDATTRWTALREGTVITGIRIRPGAVRSILGCPAGLILNGDAMLSDLVPGAFVLHQRLLLTGNLYHRHALLENWVRTAIAIAIVDHTVVAACRLLTVDPHIEIGDVTRRFGWNARMIHRQFRGACGYGPKHFQRIMRVQRAIRSVHGEVAGSLAEVAQTAGYADQAHMNRDFREITSFTPKRYFSTARPEFGVWMDESW